MLRLRLLRKLQRKGSRGTSKNLEGAAYDVLIIDRMVPGVDGLAALKALRITGVTTPDGRFIYVDRVSDLRQLRGGYRYSPGYIEGKLKFSPYVQEAIALGDSEKDYISVIVIINFLFL